MEAILEEQEVRYTFKEIENILYKQAHRVIKNLGSRYELNELVNEVWLKGNIQKLDNIKYAAARAYFDMLDYVRRMEGRKILKNGVLYQRPKAFSNTHGMNNSKLKKEDINADEDFFCNIEHNNMRYSNKSQVDLMSDKEDIENYLSCLPKRSATILRKYFLEGMELKEIGREYGFSDSYVCSVKTNALRTIREVFFIEVETKIDTRKKRKKIKDIPMEEILPEFVVDFEIGNESATKKDFVLEKDRKE